MKRFARFGTICIILKNVKNTNVRLLILVMLQSQNYVVSRMRDHDEKKIFLLFVLCYRFRGLHFDFGEIKITFRLEISYTCFSGRFQVFGS